MTKYLIFRLIRNDWNLIHMNVDTVEKAIELVSAAKVDNPGHCYRIMSVTEKVIFEDVHK